MTVVLLVGAYIIFNYSVDSLGIFHQRTEPFESYSDVNERFLKSLYLEEYCSEKNTIILGDSRSAGYETKALEKRFKNSVLFNYGVQAETLIGVYQKLKWLAGKGCFPERILIPLSIDRIDLYDYADDPRLLMQENPVVLEGEGTNFDHWLSRWTLFKKYLFSSSIFNKNLNALKNHVSGHEYHLKFLPSTGDIYYYFDHPCGKSHIKPGTVKLNSDQINYFVNELKRLYDYADSLGAEIILLWNPQLYDVQMSYDVATVETFLKKIKNISDSIYRVPLNERRLKDTNFYHDCSHFKKDLGASVLAEENKVHVFDLIKEFQNEHNRIEE